MIYKKFIQDALAQAGLNGIPETLQGVKLFTWDHDLNRDKDWDDFIGGQLVAHTYWDDGIHQAYLDQDSLQFGVNTNSIMGTLEENESFVLYTSEYIEMNNKFITVGSDLQNFYIATSYQLEQPDLKELENAQAGKEKNNFFGKIILINVQKMLDAQFNDSNESPTININIGKTGEKVKVPVVKRDNGDNGVISDPDFEIIDEEEYTIAIPKYVEVLLPKPAMFIGGGFDFIQNINGGSPDGDKQLKVIEASTKPLILPQNPFYCIAPVQWNVPSIDNYGFTHPSDRSNAIKTLLATQQMGQVAQAGIGAGSATGILSAAAGTIGSGIIGLGQMFFGDKGTLANSTAITPQFLEGEGSPLKIFIQGDGRKDKGIMDLNGYLNLQKLRDQEDYMEVNQANGQFGKFGKSMSPSQNGQFDSTQNWRGLGLQTLKLKGDPDKIPMLATPFTGTGYSDLRINDTKIQDLLKAGIPRQKINSGDILSPMLFPNTWDIYVRNMFFRPDPYSFWNFPCLMPAEVGVYDVMKPTSISYDITASGSALEMLGKESAAQKNIKDSYWSKTLTVDKITENDLYDPNKTFSSFRFKIDTDATKKLYQMHMAAITSSTVKVLLIDDSGATIREHNFNSQGKNVGTSASWGSVFQF